MDQLLLLPEEQVDIRTAKYIADLARKNNTRFHDSEAAYYSVDFCFAAGENMSVSATEKTGITNDGRASMPGLNAYVTYANAFANGWGVKQDIGRAITFACHVGDLPRNLPTMLSVLHKKSRGESPDPFDYCEYVAGVFADGKCSAAWGEKDSLTRKIYVSGLNFTPEQKKAFAALNMAADTYFDKHAWVDPPVTGSGKIGIAGFIGRRMNRDFLQRLKDFEAGKFPIDGDLDKADTMLNQYYQQVLTKYKNAEPVTGQYNITTDDIRDTERFWIRYRDAWLHFYQTRYSRQKQNAFAALLTKERSEILYWDHLADTISGSDIR